MPATWQMPPTHDYHYNPDDSYNLTTPIILMTLKILMTPIILIPLYSRPPTHTHVPVLLQGLQHALHKALVMDGVRPDGAAHQEATACLWAPAATS